MNDLHQYPKQVRALFPGQWWGFEKNEHPTGRIYEEDIFFILLVRTDLTWDLVEIIPHDSDTNF